jgi:phthiodiolone/phenolphthiodiolone dimycocerosates ketoreductase
MVSESSQGLPSDFSTAASFLAFRYMPRDVIAEQVKQLAASGVADYVYLSDQTLSWWPPSLWNPSNAPWAASFPDCESFPDPFALAGYLAAHAPGMGIMLSTDAVRYGPAELMRAALTLADLTEGRFTLMLGAGEIKQCKPFGWKRSEGLARLEDHLRLYHELWNATGPFDFQGNHWKFDQAWLGGARNYRPEIWTIGGGPKLVDLTTSYADGLTTVTPGVWSSPEKTARCVAEMKEQLRSKGRDPEAFGFGPIQMVVMHPDESVIDRVLDNPLVRFIAAIWGRLHMPDWREEGFEPPFPDDWHYAMRLLPHKMSPADIDDVLSKVSREMVEKTFIIGTPDVVAAELQRHIDAGVTRIKPGNCASVVLGPSEAEAAIAADIELLRRLKEANVRSVP